MSSHPPAKVLAVKYHNFTFFSEYCVTVSMYKLRNSTCWRRGCLGAGRRRAPRRRTLTPSWTWSREWSWACWASTPPPPPQQQPQPPQPQLQPQQIPQRQQHDVVVFWEVDSFVVKQIYYFIYFLCFPKFVILWFIKWNINSVNI